MQAKLRAEMAKISAMANQEQQKYKTAVHDIARQMGSARKVPSSACCMALG
jgi:hypothetical protein